MTEDTEDFVPEQDEQAHVVVLMDPAWTPTEPGQTPPREVVVGGWYVDENGDIGRFEPNRDYRPTQPGSPTDPVDAAMQVVVRGEADGSGLLAVMRDTVFGVAVDDTGFAVVAPAPDDLPSVLVTTAPAHRERVDVFGWLEVTFDELAEALPDEGIDVLLNPGAPTSMRIDASAVKAAATEQ